MKFELTLVVTLEALPKILELITVDAVIGIKVIQDQKPLPSETVMSAITRRRKPKKVRRSKVQEAIIEMLGQGPMSTAELRAGMDRFNLSPASTSALTPMRAEGRIVDAGEGKWALAGA